MTRHQASREQGAYLGMNQSVLSLARMTGPITAGALFDAFGARSPFLTCAGVLCASALLALYYHGRYGDTFVRAGSTPSPSS